ncbi:MAG TPA: TolC family protein [Stellaceae bacterium]|nr:TolC family protein [Stellaceae bacterium]
MIRPLGLAECFGLATLLCGCAAYHALPLPHAPDLAASVAALRVVLPADPPGPQPRRIDVRKPLDLDAIGLLAILNDPDLASERGERGAAQAAVLQATLLPNPSMSLGYGALLGGPGTTSSYAASLTEDIAAIVAYRPRVRSAQARLAQVDADLLWREWQVAQKARLLALDIYWTDRSATLDRRELALVSDELATVKAATEAGNLDLKALSPLLAAKAAAEQALAAVRLAQLRNWQDLDALLGLMPDVRFAIALPRPLPQPPDIARRIADLPERRPDLVALRLGYRSSDENVRAAILGQFPAFSLGGSWSSDNSAVRSAGPTFTFDLPIFNRNQGEIAAARATRHLLHEQYQSRLDRAVGSIRGLTAQAQRLTADLVQARAASASAASLSSAAREAYAQGDLDQRSLTDFETTALDRQLEVIRLERSLGEDRITLAVELGIGLPNARIAPVARDGT